MSQQHKKIVRYGKIGIPRHRVFSKTSAHRCEKQCETIVRRDGKKQCRNLD